nr:MAG TPA: terminase small subunit [Caudoviricetes sp.]
MESLQKIELKIKKALRNQKSYSKDLDTCITMAAGSYYAFLVALEDIKELDKSYVIEKSREGNDRMVPHPAFRVLKDTQEMVRRSLRELGLTLGTLSTEDEDALEDMLNRVEAEE